MRYSLSFKIKGEYHWLFSDDLEALTVVAASFNICHVPYQLWDRRVIIIDHHME